VLSAPRVSVLNNQRANFGVTTDEVFFAVTRQPILGVNGGTIGFDTQIQPQQIAVGIVLDVLAQIAADNTVTMNIRPAITDIVEVRELVLDDGTQTSAPVINRRETDTVVRVRNGETIVIGGLMRTALTRTETGIPGLKRLPWIGRIFGGYRETSEKRELVIFITPTIIAGQPTVAR
jgi:MSHA biogenesis protein MshL